MALVAYILAFLAFVFAVFEVSILGQGQSDMIAAGLAFLALAFLIGSLPRAPRP